MRLFMALVVSILPLNAKAEWGDPAPRGWDQVTTMTLDIVVNTISREERSGTLVARLGECRAASKGTQCTFGGSGGAMITASGPAFGPPMSVDIYGDDNSAVIEVVRRLVSATDPAASDDLILEIERRLGEKAKSGDLESGAAVYTLITERGSLAVYVAPK